ncbi:MAG: Thermonuclease precursor [Planctomycetes bacterium ADurb.Bin401]|nr:MAG: Thermonuclease precursor [Planctomycetes bacterium ADurb.Bin401]
MLSAFLFLSAIVWIDRKFHPVLREAVAPAHIQDVNDWVKYHGKSFFVVKTIDGDTIDINIPDGKYEHTRIRMLGIDTPETKSPHTPVMYYGPEASKFTADTVLEKNVTIIMDKLSNPRDKYHRILCHIQLADGRILNEELITNGLAYADPRFPHSFLDKYLTLQKKAKTEKTGLWKEVKPDQMPKWAQKKLKTNTGR